MFEGERGGGGKRESVPGFFAYFLMSILSESMNSSPQWSSMEAVPSLTNLPLLVTGLAVVPLRPAAVPRARSREVPGRSAEDEGLAKPLAGLPVRPLTCPPAAVPTAPVAGRFIEVPGLGICAIAFSSRSWSPRVSSRSSMSSSQSIAVSARHLRYQNDSS